VILDGIDYLLQKVDTAAEEFEDCGALDRLEALQANQDTSISLKATSILDKYFAGEDSQPNELQPTIGDISNNNIFSERKKTPKS
jgi:hypothetical protein